jgi:hypothetical protein
MTQIENWLLPNKQRRFSRDKSFLHFQATPKIIQNLSAIPALQKNAQALRVSKSYPKNED